MLKFLLLVGIIAVVYFIFIKKPSQLQKSNQDDRDAKKKDEPQSNEMVECSTCKIYCELDDALLSNGKYYCSKECLEKSK
ncbi:MAG: PP0621 family protein [Sulfurimonas sp.]|nr:PP0621 family protein [Sulfurimonas sp.]